MQAESLSLTFMGKAIALAAAVWISLNLLLFTVLYADTFRPLPLPYGEDFEQLTRLDYRQFGGVWRINDGKLVQGDTQKADLLAVIPLNLPPSQPYQFGTHLEILSGANGGGLLFNLQHPNSLQQSQLVRFGTDQGQDYLVYGYFDEALKFVAQGSLTPPDISHGVDLAVSVHKKTYDVLVNGQILQRDIPLQYKGGKVALTTWFSSVAFDDVAIALNAVANPPATENVTPVITASATVATQPVAAVQNIFFDEQFGNDVNQALWVPISGEWKFEPGALVQQLADAYDYSTLYANPFSQFTLRVRFRHRLGIGGGVLFNMPDVGSKANGHMVRYFEDNQLVWGYFDEKGIFIGQGNKLVDAPGDQAHTLEIVANNSTYRVLLDNQLIIEDVPLIINQGHIGLTASQSMVAFEAVTVTAFAPVQK